MRFVSAVVLMVAFNGAARAIDCTPADCDDGDPCTVDICEPGTGCVHLPSTDTTGAICLLRMLNAGLGQALALVRGSPATDLGGASVKEHLIALAVTSSRIAERIERIERCDVGTGVACKLVRGRRVFLKLCRLTATFDRILATGIARGTIDRALGERLRALVPVPSECRPLYRSDAPKPPPRR